jgi:hypothetical protein
VERLERRLLSLSMPYVAIVVALGAAIPNPSNSGASAKVRIRLPD